MWNSVALVCCLLGCHIGCVPNEDTCQGLCHLLPFLRYWKLTNCSCVLDSLLAGVLVSFDLFESSVRVSKYYDDLEHDLKIDQNLQLRRSWSRLLLCAPLFKIVLLRVLSSTSGTSWDDARSRRDCEWCYEFLSLLDLPIQWTGGYIDFTLTYVQSLI